MTTLAEVEAKSIEQKLVSLEYLNVAGENAFYDLSDLEAIKCKFDDGSEQLFTEEGDDTFELFHKLQFTIVLGEFTINGEGYLGAR